MANPEHLAILKQGVEQWNKWRKEHPDVVPDLFMAVLREANLDLVDFDGANLDSANLLGAKLDKAKFRHATLSDASLYNARLTEADLSGANCRHAHFSGGNLRGSDFTGADLSRAYFMKANLGKTQLSATNLHRAIFSGADLSAARLLDANFSGSDLKEADFTRAQAWGTIFAYVDLSVAKGLDTIVHSGPSTVGIDTIRKSKGRIPDVFLRGCGLSDWEIEAAKLYDPLLSASAVTDAVYRVANMRNNQPFQYYSCFISYSTKDQAFADRLYADLQAAGVRCWFAPEEMKAGRKLHEQIDEAIRLHDKLLLILSEHSMASDWVQTEIAKARKREAQEKRQMLFPVTLVPYDPVIRDWECFDADRGKDSAREVREYYIPDFSNWKNHDSYQAALQRLVKDLKS